MPAMLSMLAGLLRTSNAPVVLAAQRTSRVGADELLTLSGKQVPAVIADVALRL